MVVFYDLQICPTTFDFINFLAISASLANDRGLHVVVGAPDVRNIGVEREHSIDHVQIKFRNVVIKVLSMCDWVKSFEVKKLKGLIDAELLKRVEFPTAAQLQDLAQQPWHSVFQCLPIQLENLYRLNFKLPSRGFSANRELQSAYADIVGPQAVVFQPRASKFNSFRNTPVHLFSRLAERLRGRGYRCFVIGDAEDLLGDEWSNCGIDRLEGGQFDLEHRIAASLAARLNICWNGGAMVPLQYSAARFVSFGTYNSRGGPVTSREFFERKGPIFGKRPSWYLQDVQHIDWSDASTLTPEYMESVVLARLQ